MPVRTSRPHSLLNPTPEAVTWRIVARRRQRPTGAHVAARTGVSSATVSRVLRRAGLSRLRDLEPAEPMRRHDRAHPGELIRLDIEQLGTSEKTGHRITRAPRPGKSRGAGWECVHVCIDDHPRLHSRLHSRLSFTQIHPDERAVSAVADLKAAVAWYAAMGLKAKRVMSDNGSCCISHAFKAACKQSGIRHIRTKPHTPRTNARPERFIQTALREWACAHAHDTSQQRAADLPRWTHL